MGENSRAKTFSLWISGSADNVFRGGGIPECGIAFVHDIWWLGNARGAFRDKRPTRRKSPAPSSYPTPDESG